MATEKFPVLPSKQSLFNPLLTKCFYFKYCNFYKTETQKFIGITHF